MMHGMSSENHEPLEFVYEPEGTYSSRLYLVYSLSYACLSVNQEEGEMILSSLKFLMAYILQQLRHPSILKTVSYSWRPRSVKLTTTSAALSRKGFLPWIPSNSWDSHMHVVDPVNYALAKDARYVPKTHTVLDATNFESSVGLHNIVLVQPSIYGNDNTCMLDALRQLGPQRGRAVVAFDPNLISNSTIEEWHSIGVRGVRLNLHSVGRKLDSKQLKVLLHQYADMIRPLNWVLQLYVSMATVIELEEIVPGLGVRVCLDHFAVPALHDKSSPYQTTRDPYLLPGFKPLVKLLSQGSTFVKISAPYRISDETDYADLEPVGKELLRVASKRVVFATDWPHTRFEGLGIEPFIEKVLEWCGHDEELVERLFRTNAEGLWGMEGAEDEKVERESIAMS
jgi:predicted TIM-barrel fold metal-dependent hydrolase